MDTAAEIRKDSMSSDRGLILGQGEDLVVRVSRSQDRSLGMIVRDS